jgi:peroxiredoxin
MAVVVGDRIPDVEVQVLNVMGMPESIRTGEVFGVGRHVLFAVPGAFTPGCSRQHLPGFISGVDSLLGRGVHRVSCIGVNDPWVMEAWAISQGVDDRILMLSDGNLDFAHAMDLVFDGRDFGLGLRSRRYALLAVDGVIQQLKVEEDLGVAVSSCDSIAREL